MNAPQEWTEMEARNVEARIALKQALDALETERDIYREHDEDGAPEYILDAIAALEVLAQPAVPQGHEQDPVGKIVDCDFVGNSIARFERHLPFGTLLYTHPSVPYVTPSRTAQPDLETKSATIERAREASRQLRERNKTTWNDVDREAVFAFEALIAVANFFYLKSKDTAQPKEPEQDLANEWSEWTAIAVQNLMRHGLSKFDARQVALFLKDKAPQLKPLTDEQIEYIWNRYCDELGEASINDALDIARAIEAAHGITEE